MKKEQGITLIALVVTVIILLILAGVSFNFLIGDSGIFSSTRYSIEQDEKGKVEDEIRLSIAAAEVEYYKNFNPSNIGSVGKAKYYGDGSFYEECCTGAKKKANGKPDVSVTKGEGVSNSSNTGEITVLYRSEKDVVYTIKFNLEKPTELTITP